MNETALKIKTVGERVLRKKAKPVKQLTDKHRQMLSSMAQMMYESSGVGLAAPQVGISYAMIVVDIGNGLYKLINPRIIKKQGTQAIEEGCLSVPGITVKVKRAKKIMLHALDQDGKPVKIEAENLLACVFQHEIDHLQGKLIIDYAPLWKRLAWKNMRAV